MSIVSADWIKQTLCALNLVECMDQPEGFTRLGYTQAEWEAMDVFENVARELGLSVYRDAAGNRIARWEVGLLETASVNGEEQSIHTNHNVSTPSTDQLPAVAMGSHLDTVENGGGYDGVAGVLCALGAVKWLRSKSFQPVRPIEIICFASARFGISTIGSKAMAGILPVDSIRDVSDKEGVTIRQAVESRGLSWERIHQAERSKEAIKSFVELHIEQGQRIEKAGAQFGVATAIACPIRLKVCVQGQMGHTGTTQMDQRRDALVAVAPLITFIHEEALRLNEGAQTPLVATVSTIRCQPNAMNVIPGRVEVGVDIRSVDDQLKQKMHEAIQKTCIELEQRFHVTITIQTLVNNASVHLDDKVSTQILEIGKQLGYRGIMMESGAGHDVMNMASRWPAGLLFIPCENGLSHHPDERATLDDLALGIHILAAYMEAEAGD